MVTGTISRQAPTNYVRYDRGVPFGYLVRCGLVDDGSTRRIKGRLGELLARDILWVKKIFWKSDQNLYNCFRRQEQQIRRTCTCAWVGYEKYLPVALG